MSIPRFGDVAARLVANGYKPVPVGYGTKDVLPKEWTQYEYPREAQRWANEATSLLTKLNPAGDIDVRDAALAAELDELLVRMIGAGPKRIGRAPKLLRVFRLEGEPFEKIQTAGYRLPGDSPEDKPHKVEILADRQQFVCYNRHPETGKPYTWNGSGDPLSVPSGELPTITREQAQAFIDAAEKRLAAVGTRVGKLQAKDGDRPHVTSDAQRAADPRLCRAALAAIPNEDLDWDDWVYVGLAVKGALGEDGFDAFDSWSSKSTKYNAQKTAKQFASFEPKQIGAGTIYHLAEEHGWKRSCLLLGPAASIGTRDEWHGFPYEPPEIVANFIPEDAGGSVGPGGHGKTTLALYESIMIRLGRPLYGRKIARSGPTLVVTAEDRREIVFSRTNQICRGLRLNADEIEHVRTGIFVEDVTGSLARIAEADRSGAVHPGALMSGIVDAYKDAGLATVILDPTSLLGPGETFGNDGAAALLRISRYLSRELRAAVRLIHHVSQEVARNKLMDQYAARGGTAFVDNSRFQHQLIVLEERKLVVSGWGTFRVPDRASDAAIAKGRVLGILVHKLSYAERDRVPIFVLRDGFEFTYLEALGGDMSVEEHEAETAKDAATIHAFLVRKTDQGHFITANSLVSDYLDEVGLTRIRAQKAIAEARRIGAVVETDLPPDQRRGQRKTYLKPTSEYPL
ncbi:MAG: PriCT-2 domain-containing protein [Proteobacteria bacterium]|nr:PriCT-2 domain-containing protein [Pseudomonadota bacterium]